MQLGMWLQYTQLNLRRRCTTIYRILSKDIDVDTVRCYQLLFFNILFQDFYAENQVSGLPMSGLGSTEQADGTFSGASSSNGNMSIPHF